MTTIASMVTQVLVDNNISMNANEWEYPINVGTVTDLFYPVLLNQGVNIMVRGDLTWDEALGHTVGSGFQFEVSPSIELPDLCDEGVDLILLRECSVTVGPP